MDLESFESYLRDKTSLSNTTIISYLKNVKRCLKKNDVELYIQSIKSSSHRSFVKSSWSSWITFTSSQKKPHKDIIQMFNVMKNLDAEKVLSAKISQRSEIQFRIVYMTEKGILHLTKEEESVLSRFSKGDHLFYWS